MGHASEEEKLHYIRRRVDEILYYIWDPIGVREEPYCRSEYRDYASHAFEMLMNGATAEEIGAYLDHITTDWMDLQAKPEHTVRVGELLLKTKKYTEEMM